MFGCIGIVAMLDHDHETSLLFIKVTHDHAQHQQENARQPNRSAPAYAPRIQQSNVGTP